MYILEQWEEKEEIWLSLVGKCYRGLLFFLQRLGATAVIQEGEKKGGKMGWLVVE